MQVWSFINPKGGCGKTTIAVNVAARLARGWRVILIDTDEQKSALTWAGTLPDEKLFPVVACDEKHMLAPLIKSLGEFDYIIIDTPGNLGTLASVVIQASDKVIVPVVPSGIDFWATETLIDLLGEWKEARREMSVHLLMSMVQVNTKAEKMAPSALAGFGLPIIPYSTYRRAPYMYAMSEGLSVCEYKFKEGINEIANITDYLQSVVGQIKIA